MKTEKDKISVVVVTYNSSPFISECLKSLTSNRFSCPEIIVIDNASSDKEVCHQIAEKFPGVRFVQNEKNIGYGAALNQGAGMASGKYLFFINPDMIIPEGTTEKLSAFMESHPDCGACSPYIETPERSWLYRWLLFQMPIDVARRKIAGKYCYKVKFLLGCAIFIERAFFLKELKGFDENFFLYYEDNDLGERIRACGKSNCVVLSASVIHFHGKSSAYLPRRKKGEILAKSRWYFAKKHNLWGLKIWYQIYTPLQRFLCWATSWL